MPPIACASQAHTLALARAWSHFAPTAENAAPARATTWQHGQLPSNSCLHRALPPSSSKSGENGAPVAGIVDLSLAVSLLVPSPAVAPTHCRVWCRQRSAPSIRLVEVSSPDSPAVVQAGFDFDLQSISSVESAATANGSTSDNVSSFNCAFSLYDMTSDNASSFDCAITVNGMTSDNVSSFNCTRTDCPNRASGLRWIHASLRSPLPVFRMADTGCVLTVGSAAHNRVRASELRWTPASIRSLLPIPPPQVGIGCALVPARGASVPGPDLWQALARHALLRRALLSRAGDAWGCGPLAAYCIVIETLAIGWWHCALFAVALRYSLLCCSHCSPFSYLRLGASLLRWRALVAALARCLALFRCSRCSSRAARPLSVRHRSLASQVLPPSLVCLCCLLACLCCRVSPLFCLRWLAHSRHAVAAPMLSAAAVASAFWLVLRRPLPSRPRRPRARASWLGNAWRPRRMQRRWDDARMCHVRSRLCPSSPISHCSRAASWTTRGISAAHKKDPLRSARGRTRYCLCANHTWGKWLNYVPHLGRNCLVNVVAAFSWAFAHKGSGSSSAPAAEPPSCRRCRHSSADPRRLSSEADCISVVFVASLAVAAPHRAAGSCTRRRPLSRSATWIAAVLTCVLIWHTVSSQTIPATPYFGGPARAGEASPPGPPAAF